MSSNREKYDPNLWVDEHADALYRFALLRVKDPVLAEDLVQETLFAGLKGIDGFKGGSTLRTWLVSILRHKIIDHFRRNRPEILTSDLSLMENETAEERLERGAARPEWKEWRDVPSNLMENKEFWEVFTSCLDGLPDNHRRAFAMREIDGVKGEEICKILDITPTNLWVILHRARGRLRSCLESNWFDAG